jgi:hypothetical protein
MAAVRRFDVVSLDGGRPLKQGNEPALALKKPESDRLSPARRLSDLESSVCQTEHNLMQIGVNRLYGALASLGSFVEFLKEPSSDGIALTGGAFEALRIKDVNTASLVLNQAAALQDSRHQSDGRSPCADHVA